MWSLVRCCFRLQEKRLLEAIAPLERTLTDEERRRNSRGHTLISVNQVCLEARAIVSISNTACQFDKLTY